MSEVINRENADEMFHITARYISHVHQRNSPLRESMKSGGLGDWTNILSVICLSLLSQLNPARDYHLLLLSESDILTR